MTSVRFGIDRLITDPALRQPLIGRRVALVAHPASLTAGLVHSLDALAALPEIRLTAAFGPQHGLKGDKQDNMVETADFHDPDHGIPVFSLYGQVRRPTAAMIETADVFLFDLQDLGCRIYTFVTTLLYLLEAVSGTGKAVWVLDRPNPAGRPVEGMTLLPGYESFVGAGPMPMRHGLTLGEMGRWFVDHFGLDVDYRVIAMDGWQGDAAPGFGWPTDRIWINPSPNAASLNMARAYAGTVMIEGATVSEGRGTTRPLEVLFGAPDVAARDVLAENAAVCATMDDRLRLARMLVRTDVSQTRASGVFGADDPCRGAVLRPPRVPAMAAAGTGVQGHPDAVSRLPAVARFPV